MQAASAQTLPAVPAGAPAYVAPMWQSALSAPLPAGPLSGSAGATVPQNESDLDLTGVLGTYQPGGATTTSGNAFFTSLGTNGRACSTCHLPSNGMSVSIVNIVARYLTSAGKDPIFAPVDGANCPSAVPAASTKASYLGKRLGNGLSMANAHSLILTRGVFRIFLPVPATRDYTIKVVSDPTGCNTNPIYDQVVDANGNPVLDANGNPTQIISVFRRPLLATNLDFATTVLSFGGPPGPSGNIMWDGREPTLTSQALDATLGHAQATVAPTAAQLAQMVAFEQGIYSAQSSDFVAGSLTAGGAMGGPVNLSTFAAGVPGNNPPLPGTIPTNPPAPNNDFSIFESWATVTGTSAAAERRASIYRGQELFNNYPITITNVAGLNQILGPTVNGSCATCHNATNGGSDAFGNAQHGIGVGGDSVAFGGPAPATDLPIFEITCNPGSTTYNGQTVVRTNDPAFALISGKCNDVGSSTVPTLRALASHPPYFRDGSALTLLAVVNFYNSRFSMGLSTQQKTDLVNFLNAL
jgi:cytochrome c peroxidase